MIKFFKTLHHRFFWKTDDTKFVPFLPFFAMQNLIIGLFFAFGSFIPQVAELKLFVILTAFLPPPFTAALWGFAIILLFIGHCAEMYFRGKGIGPHVAMSGFILWCYALGVYMSDVSIMGMIGIVAPQLFFWGWYYLEAKKYKRDLRKGRISEVS